MSGGYKEWISDKADELAMELYGVDFFHQLTETQQVEVYDKAVEAWKGYIVSEVDGAREAAKWS